MTDDDYIELLREVDEYEQVSKATETQMKASQGDFMVAYGTTLEVLGVAGEVKLGGERYNKKGP